MESLKTITVVRCEKFWTIFFCEESGQILRLGGGAAGREVKTCRKSVQVLKLMLKTDAYMSFI